MFLVQFGNIWFLRGILNDWQKLPADKGYFQGSFEAK